MIKELYTVILVPHTGEQFRKWRLSSGVVKAFAALAGVALFSTVGLVVHYVAFYLFGAAVGVAYVAALRVLV